MKKPQPKKNDPPPVTDLDPRAATRKEKRDRYERLKDLDL